MIETYKLPDHFLLLQMMHVFYHVWRCPACKLAESIAKTVVISS